MNQRVNFWCGVVAGCISSIVLFVVILIAFKQTYKFFNESWTAILEVAENDNKRVKREG